MKHLKSQEGFTLVELMVVVAIIGILSAVAIPNFKRYQAKTKTSEAKLQLSAIYSALISLQSDYDAFGSCLVDAGYTAPTQNYYSVGMDAAAAANAIIVNNGGVCGNTNFQFGAQKRVGGAVLAATAVTDVTAAEIDVAVAGSRLDNTASNAGIGKAGVDATGSYFVAVATGNIDPDFTSGTVAASMRSKWGINENKFLREISRGY